MKLSFGWAPETKKEKVEVIQEEKTKKPKKTKDKVEE